jgi:D-tyrosyl-tRNA(Tyr) deacylase
LARQKKRKQVEEKNDNYANEEDDHNEVDEEDDHNEVDEEDDHNDNQEIAPSTIITRSKTSLKNDLSRRTVHI